MKHSPLFPFIWLATGGLLAGCMPSGPTPIAADTIIWQKSVEHYVIEEGNGDPNILRDTTLPDSQKGFALLGDPSVAGASDVDGLLLGHRIIGSRPWFLFLVAEIQKGVIKDIRLVAMNCEGTHFTWRASADTDAAQRYRAASRPMGDSMPGETPSNHAFPLPSDRFQISVTNTRVRVRQRGSTASWSLDLGEDSISPRTAVKYADSAG